MSHPRQQVAALLGLAFLSLLIAACGGGHPPETSRYTFKAQEAGVDVDTPALRALKSSAGIEPCPASSSPGDVPVGLPDLTLPCLGGGRDVRLAGLRGPLVLNFWAQYCGPCRAESPLLQQLSTAAAGRVDVVGVDFLDTRPALALAFAKSLGLTYPQVADPDGAAKAPLRIPGLPWTFFVDRAGRIAYTQTGAITSAEQLAALVRTHLGVTVLGLAKP